LQHGGSDAQPKALLKKAGTVLDIPEGHLCCGWPVSITFYSPDSGALRDRKAGHISAEARVVAR
jgi:glycolate oxidase iron-sulfur subunit